MQTDFPIPEGWALRHCPACAIKLVVRVESKDNKRCGVCNYTFEPTTKSEIIKKFAEENGIPVKEIVLPVGIPSDSYIGATDWNAVNEAAKKGKKNVRSTKRTKSKTRKAS